MIVKQFSWENIESWEWVKDFPGCMHAVCTKIEDPFVVLLDLLESPASEA